MRLAVLAVSFCGLICNHSVPGSPSRDWPDITGAYRATPRDVAEIVAALHHRSDIRKPIHTIDMASATRAQVTGGEGQSKSVVTLQKVRGKWSVVSVVNDFDRFEIKD